MKTIEQIRIQPRLCIVQEGPDGGFTVDYADAINLLGVPLPECTIEEEAASEEA